MRVEKGLIGERFDIEVFIKVVFTTRAGDIIFECN